MASVASNPPASRQTGAVCTRAQPMVARTVGEAEQQHPGAGTTVGSGGEATDGPSPAPGLEMASARVGHGGSMASNDGRRPRRAALHRVDRRRGHSPYLNRRRLERALAG